MTRIFAITTSTPSIRLNGTGQGELTFTVSNALGRRVRGRALVEPEGATPGQWLVLEGEPERDFPPDGTHQYSVRVAVPPGTSQGQHAFHLSVVNVANPDEEFAVGPSASFQVPLPQAPAPKKKFPWAWVALAAGILLLSLVTFFALRGGDEEQAIGGSGAVEQSTTEPAPAPNQTFLRLDEKDAFVELGNPRHLNFFGTITLEVWLRPRALNGLRNIVAHGYNSSPAGEVYLRFNSGRYEVGSWNGQDAKTTAEIPSEDVGTWVHLAGVYDGARWILYRNGELASSTPQTMGSIFVDAPWAIGARGGGPERFFEGDLRDVRIWRIPRGQKEIRADMKRTLSGNETGLIGYWPLNEGQDVLARDLSPHKHDGVIRKGGWGTE